MSRPERISIENSVALPTGVAISDSRPSPLEVAVYRKLADVTAEWREFEARAAGTFYQTHAWCAAWLESRNGASEPRIIVGREPQGTLRFLLPLCIRRAYGLDILEWIATPQTTYGYGLYDRDFLPKARAWFSGRGWQIARQAGKVDALHLGEMPHSLHGFPHPLSDWFSCEGPNRGYQILLDPDYQRLYQRKRSAATRRSNRKRDNKLESLGRLSFELPVHKMHARARLDEMFTQQQARLAQRGIHDVFDRRDRAFIHRLAGAGHDGGPGLLPYHLCLDGQMVAMKLGGLYGNTYWGLISSLDTSLAPHLSPGDAALRRLIAACCERQLAILDLASGDAPYKSQWADVVIPLHACVRGLTLLGYIWASYAMIGIILKRTIKRSPRLWELAQNLRGVAAMTRSRIMAESPLGCLVGLNLTGIA